MSADSQVIEPDANRRPVHVRQITCEGFERTDGLFDIEATLIDRKPFPQELHERTVAAGEPVHQMSICLTIDRQWTIRNAYARTFHAPYSLCGDIAESYRKLIGMKLQPGFTQEVKRMFRGIAGCSHLTELLPPLATTAFQILWANPKEFDVVHQPGSGQRSSPLEGCHAMRLDGVVVKRHFSHLLKSD